MMPAIDPVQWFDVRGFLLLLLVFVPLERLLTLHAGQRMLRRGWAADLVYIFVNRLPIQAGLLLMLALLGIGARGLIPAEVRAAVGSQPVWLQTAEVLLVADLGFYAAHRLFHAVPWLWRFHTIHHSIEELDWLAAARVHPIDQIVTKGMSLLPVYVLGFSTEAIVIHATVYLWHSVLLHANVRLRFGPLRWLVASPEFHHWHHGNQPEAFNRNFAGQLAILDVLFGTAHMPRGILPSKYGVDEPVPGNYIGGLLYPFKRPGPSK